VHLIQNTLLVCKFEPIFKLTQAKINHVHGYRRLECGDVIELLISYNNYFIERVYIFPKKPVIVEREFVHFYEGDLKYYP
jgi:hypothetical protein